MEPENTPLEKDTYLETSNFIQFLGSSSISHNMSQHHTWKWEYMK